MIFYIYQLQLDSRKPGFHSVRDGIGIGGIGTNIGISIIGKSTVQYYISVLVSVMILVILVKPRVHNREESV